ncbi:hypothetical protein C457_10826 [Haloferax prahovense DSM 18310]|uniref:Uncharacterized protein n=1 Tax=Haloferax prahovense (strain DSM 18310 / JCM 13924 / TL6) TaxID=1227461 RepID=M0GDL1_HALPT|nr:hypothetical protein C457_10826 [Haloferax prahovense DSM 18310]
MYFLFSAILGGNLTLITVVISINQLVLSRELGAPGDLHQQIRDAMAYRREVESSSGEFPSPVSPAEFLQFLHEAIHADAAELQKSVSESNNERLLTRVDTLVSDLSDDVEDVTRSLDTTRGEMFTAIEATLGTNHAEQLYELDAINAECDGLSERHHEILGRLEDQLLHIDTARKYFRTVYMEKELSYLSRVILYVGVPTEVLTALVLTIYGSIGTISQPPVWVLPLTIVAVTVGFAPLAVLFSFVLRLSWVAQQNTSVAPFSTGDETPPF